MRWAEAAIIFQGALHSLNPVRRIETQIAEPIRLHEPELSSAAAVSPASVSSSSRSACPPPGPGSIPTSSRVASGSG